MRRMVLERATTSADGLGGQAEVWEALGQIWVDVTPERPREVEDGGRVLAIGRARMLCRAAPAGDTRRPRVGDRLRSEATVWRVIGVTDPVPGRLQLFVEEGRA